MGRTWAAGLGVMVLLCAAGGAALAETPYTVAWVRQIGTPSYDKGYCVVADGAGGVYISGYTEGSLGGPNAGYSDAFLIKYEVPEPATLALVALGGLALLRPRPRK